MSETTTERPIEASRLEALAAQMVGHLTGAAVTAGVVLGDQLGLYRTLDACGVVTADGLAERAGCHPRLVREWLDGQSAAGLVEYEAAADTYRLTGEAAMILADEDSPAFMAGGAASFQAMFHAVPKLLDAFRGDGGLPWGEHHPVMFESVARFFRPGYRTNLVAEWLPALDDLIPKLAVGGAVADIGCGFGHSCLLMAEAFPHAKVAGFDFHEPSIARARQLASEAGLAERVRYEPLDATSYSGEFDLICFFDCLHDMGDPVAVARHAREHLREGGSVMLVEPFALPDRPANLTANPAAAMYYHASTFLCTPCSLAQPGRAGMGAQSGPTRMGEVMAAAGFSRFDAVHTSPFNVVYQAKS